jgi:Uma2 family endonuclease
MLKITAPELLMPRVELPLIELPTEDGVPLETNWHRIEMNLLIESVHSYWRERDDYFAGGNMFIYFSMEQARHRDYRGPDFFVVKDVDGTRDRAAWIVWEENGRYPNLIVELASPSTIDVDLGAKLRLYERTFRTPEYFCYDPAGHELLGWRLSGDAYEVIESDEHGWLWSEELGLWLGNWEGEFQRVTTTWLRFYTQAGTLLLTLAESEAQRAAAESQRAAAESQRAAAEAQRAAAEAQRAAAEAQRADRAEAELTQLRAQLSRLGITAGETPGETRL